MWLGLLLLLDLEKDTLHVVLDRLPTPPTEILKIRWGAGPHKMKFWNLFGADFTLVLGLCPPTTITLDFYNLTPTHLAPP